MVTIVDYSVRENKEGKSFVTLKIQGDLVMVQSTQTGHFYATAKSCTITSTFTEEAAKALLGRQIPGGIERVDCEQYDYVIPDTGEVIQLTHRYEFYPEGVPVPSRQPQHATLKVVRDAA